MPYTTRRPQAKQVETVLTVQRDTINRKSLGSEAKDAIDVADVDITPARASSSHKVSFLQGTNSYQKSISPKIPTG